MESQPQNPEFKNNPESFHPCKSELCYKGTNLQKGIKETYHFMVIFL